MLACTRRQSPAHRPCVLVMALGALLCSVLPSRAQCVPEPADEMCLEAVDPSPLDARVPLLLIHGINQTAIPGPPWEDLWGPFIGYYRARPALIANFKLYRVLYWSNRVGIGVLGMTLRDKLDVMSDVDPDGFGSKPIVIVAHSMGGLISRDYMGRKTNKGLFADTYGAARVLRLITLGTPHHGSMLANGEPMEDAAGAGWGTALTLFNGFFYLTGGLTSGTLNRSELRWDNYDPNHPQWNDASYPDDIDDFLRHMNKDSSRDKKIIAYAGLLDPSDAVDVYPLGEKIIRGAFGMQSDGVVPVSSAFFYDERGNSRALIGRPWSDYNHSELPSGKGDWQLFHQLESDLLSALESVAPSTGLITTVAGGGSGGTGSLATEDSMSELWGVAVDGAGDLYIPDTFNYRIKKVTASTGMITVVAGATTFDLGDGGPATAASVRPYDVAVDLLGNIYVLETFRSRIRKVTAATGLITTVAGTGVGGFSGDGGPATQASLGRPYGVAVDRVGNIYIADTDNARVRQVTVATGFIATVAGSGIAGFSGDGGPATMAQLSGPVGVALDGQDNLYIASGHRVRKVAAATGIITTVAGTSMYGFSGDGGPATDARLWNPHGIAVDRAGNLYIADSSNKRIRRVAAATGIITTVAGTGEIGFSGDGGSATSAELNYPKDVAVDETGKLYIADYWNNRIRMVVLDTSATVASVARGDVTGDLKSDILWRHGTRGEVWLWPMNGAAKVSETPVRTVADTTWEIRGQGDQTGDRKADILWRNTVTGQIYFWPMNGSTPLDEEYVATVSTAYDVVGTGDFNGDGKSDILWRQTTLGDVWIWLMDGATPLAEVFMGRVDPAYVVKGVGDLDGNGKADIVWHHATTGGVWVWLMDGTTRLSEMYVASVQDTTYQIQAVADFDGDGRADILWWNTARGEVWIWLMDGTTRLSQTQAGTVADTNYRIVGAGDYDGDTKADILWRNVANGEVWVWLMDGTLKRSETWIGTVPDTGYQIVKAK